jgi:hypothetical protein
MAEGFLGRWSQRKQAQRAGKALDEPLDEPATQPVSVVVDASTTNHSTLGPHPVQVKATPDADPINQGGAAGPGAPASPAQVAPLSLDDVQRLTTESDFKPFVPHYNVMDRLDIYIDDYSQPDPLPQSMLRQMASAQFLNLFEEEKIPPPPLGDDANTRSADSVAQSVQPPDAGVATPPKNPPQAPGPDHDHTDLRLQPNHAAGRQESGRGTE